MIFFKKILFSLLPALILLMLIEGGARLYWSHLQNAIFKEIEESFTDLLQKEKEAYKVVNFVKVTHPILGYVLAPSFHGSDDVVTNSHGFFQVEEVNLEKKENSLRIMTVGESTTQGASVRHTSYPVSLNGFFKDYNSGFPGGVEVINAGIAGWISDQWSLATNLKFAAYKPDIVIFYCGWNDFQSYSPYSPPQKDSYYKYWESNGSNLLSAPPLKSVTLLKEWFGAKKEKYKKKLNRIITNTSSKVTPGFEQPKELYKFFIRNLNSSINAFREQNPNVKIIISPLIGRWPHDTQEQFEGSQGRIWWMIDTKVTREHASSLLELFNGVIEDYAKENKLHFIDMRKTFKDLDKQNLFVDFCHLTHEGYKIIAKTFFDYITKNLI